MAKYVMIAMTNCEPGKEAEFNEWYDRIHLPDLLKVPGIVAAQRYRLTDEQRRDTRPDFGYMAVYELESNDLQKTFGIMNEQLATVHRSPTLLNPTWAYFFKPVGRRQVKAGTRPKKAARLPAKKAARKTARSTVKRKTARKAK